MKHLQTKTYIYNIPLSCMDINPHDNFHLVYRTNPATIGALVAVIVWYGSYVISVYHH